MLRKPEGSEACPRHEEGKIFYTSKDGRTNKCLPALEWLAAMSSHIPNRGERMVRYYGYYNNASRGKRKKAGNDDAVPSIIESRGDEKIFRRNWVRLIQKIYEVDPLVCAKCQGANLIGNHDKALYKWGHNCYKRRQV